MLFDYDDTNINSVLNYAKKIEDLTFRDILVENILLLLKMARK